MSICRCCNASNGEEGARCAGKIQYCAPAGEYLQLAQAFGSKEQLLDTFKLHFPPFPAGNNAEAQPLRSLFALLVPRGLWNVRHICACLHNVPMLAYFHRMQTLRATCLVAARVAAWVNMRV